MGARLQFNPSTGKLSFNPATDKVQVVGPFAQNDCCCFLEPATPGACGNTEWDSYPPYGGPGTTPEEYTVTITDIPAIAGFSGVLIPSKINGTHTLIYDPPVFGTRCVWLIVIPDATSTGASLTIAIDVSILNFAIFAIPSSQIGNVYVQFSSEPCEIEGIENLNHSGTDYTVEWNPN